MKIHIEENDKPLTKKQIKQLTVEQPMKQKVKQIKIFDKKFLCLVYKNGDSCVIDLEKLLNIELDKEITNEFRQSD